MGAMQHLVARSCVCRPKLYGEPVDRADLPLAQRIAPTLFEPTRLLLPVDVEIIFEQPDAAIDQHPLKDGRIVEKPFYLFFGTKPHDALDAGTVVPGAVE